MCKTPGPAVLRTSELRKRGWTAREIRAARTAGRIQQIRQGVYALPGACRPLRTAARHGGSLACVSAARHLGIWVLEKPPAPHVWMRGHGHRRSCPPISGADACGCVEHWDDGPSPTDAFGLPRVSRILRHVLACRGVEEFFVAVESALRQRLLTRSGLAWLRANVNAEGRAALAIARSDADSGLESLVRWRLRHRGLRITTQPAIVGVGRVDVLIGDRLLIEVDGVKNHASRKKRHKDLVRDAAAAAWGYVTLRFDYAQVVHDWPSVEAAILGQIDAGHHLR